MRTSLFTPIARSGPGHDDVILNSESLILDLLLYDRLVVHSMRLLEVPALVQQFGADAVLGLLASGVMTIKCDSNIPGIHGPDMNATRPHYTYTFSLIRAAHYDDYLSTCLSRIREMPSVPKRVKQKLVYSLHDSIDRSASGLPEAQWPELRFFNETLADLRRDTPILKTAFEDEIRRTTRPDVDVSAVRLSLEATDDSTFRAHTNLSEALRVSDEVADGIVAQTLLRFVVLSQILAAMSRYDSVAVLHPRFGMLLEERFRVLGQTAGLAPKSQLTRVLDIAGLPDLGSLAEAGGVDLNRLLDLRHDEAMLSFRHWLSGLTDATDEEILSQIDSMSRRLAVFVRTPAGRSLRVLLSFGVGVANPVAGLITSAMDMFCLERVLPVPGPILFLNARLMNAFDPALIADKHEVGGLTTLNLRSLK